MADPIFEVPDSPEYNTEIRKLQTTDPAHADNTFNPLFETLIGNTHYVKKKTDELAETMEDGINAAQSVAGEAKTAAAAAQFAADEAKAAASSAQSTADEAKSAATTAQSAAEAAQVTANEAKEAAQNADIDSKFVLSITFDTDMSGQAFFVTGGELNYSSNVPNSLRVVVEAPTADTTYTITCDGYSVTVSVGQFYGIYSASLLRISTTLADNSWAKIAQVAESGQAASYWSIGDEKDITLTTGETLTLQIYDFAHDDLATGGKAGITFGMKDLMADIRPMEASNINTNGFTGSTMYAWLTGTLLPSLPSDLQSVIKPVIKKTSAGSASTTILSETMSIFLFSEVECFGSTTYSVAGEGEQYPIFTDAASRVKYQSGSANLWWERSPRASDSAAFCVVANDGNANAYLASGSWGVAFGFCI